MIFDKEYPATHSMDTTWFAVDEAGEVAIFQFEENGPVPFPFTDIHSDELLSYFGKKENGVTIMPFTDEQLDVLASNLTEPTVEMLNCCCNVVLAPGGFEILKANHAEFDICYSKERNFYHIEWWSGEYHNEPTLQKLIDEKIVLKACPCDIELYFEERCEEPIEERLKYFPFYVYRQDEYSQMCVPKRTIVPKVPLKEERIPEEAKKYVIHLPVRFAEQPQVQPAEFVDSECWGMQYGVKEVNGVKYLQVQLTDGRYGYVKMQCDRFPKSEGWDEAERVIDITNEPQEE